jgi:bifunctional DNase/RNase
MIDMKVLGLTLDGTTRAPILVLKAVQGEDVLPLWIGGVEAMSISLALTGTRAERPLTHDLMVGLLRSLGVSLVGVSIVDVRDGVFYAMLDVVRGTEMLQIDCRPSDGIALALRLKAPIRATAAALARAPRERYQAAVSGQGMLSDETGEIVRRSLKMVEAMLIAPDRSPDKSPAGEKAGGRTMNAPTPGKPELSRRPDSAGAPAPPASPGSPASPVSDDDFFARMLRDLEPTTKNRM